MKFYRFLNAILNAVLLILLVVFITLKLLKVIAWSWWWVLAPAWMPLVVIVLLGLSAAYVLRKDENKNWNI